ncbi:hypothetical protein OMR07_29115, partial [Methylobacterium organophilum]|nr:hypothetical protein [Methylobacterium organophilum]
MGLELTVGEPQFHRDDPEVLRPKLDLENPQRPVRSRGDRRIGADAALRPGRGRALDLLLDGRRDRGQGGGGLARIGPGPVARGAATLKEAVDSAFEEYLKDPHNYIYAIGSVVGPHPFPKMVRDFQSIIGNEAREQFLAKHGRLPDHVVACVGGGSNAMGMFTAFLEDAAVELVGIEPAGESLDKPGRHSAT